MTYRLLLFTFLLLSVLFLYSCNNTGYEIEEEEGTESPKSETHTEIKQDIQQPKTDIKDEAVKDTSTINKTSAKMYCIQIGAFVIEANAKDLAARVKKQIDFDVAYVKVDGLYKVRAGVFGSKTDAFSALQKIADAGFKDAFVTEINK